MLFNVAVTNQTQPETSPSLMGDVASGLLPAIPQATASGPGVGLGAVGGSSEIFIRIIRVLLPLHSCCNTLRGVYSE